MMDTTKEIIDLSKQQRKIAKSIVRNEDVNAYKREYHKELNANPPPDQERKLWLENMLKLIEEEELTTKPARKLGGWGLALLFFGSLLLLYITASIYESDIFQRTVNPKKYWRIQVALLEQDIIEKELYIKKCEKTRSATERLPKTDYLYDELVRNNIINGKDPEEAKRIAQVELKKIVENAQRMDDTILKMKNDLLSFTYKDLAETRIKLEQARKELSKYQ